MATKPTTPTDIDARPAELAAKEAELAKREAALAEKLASLPAPKFTARNVHRALLMDPAVSVEQLAALAREAGSSIGAATIKTNRALALSFIALAKETGHWQNAVP